MPAASSEKTLIIQKFEELYTSAQEAIDEIAERI